MGAVAKRASSKRTVVLDIILLDSCSTLVSIYFIIGVKSKDGPILPVIPPVTSREPENTAGPMLVKVEEPETVSEPVIVWSPTNSLEPVRANEPVLGIGPIGP
jgi:hypothetical protein